MSNTLKQKFTFVITILYPTFFWVLSQCVILPKDLDLHFVEEALTVK